MKGTRNLCKWGKKYLFMLLSIIVLSTVLQLLYSYIPVLIQFAFKQLGRANDNINLPDGLIHFFESFKEPIQIIMVVGISIIVLQAFRSILRFIDNYLQGRLTENIARDMRVEMYNHVADLSYSYHNNVDTGDLIQRCTSDIDTSSGFISGKFPELINIFATIAIGAYQVYQINATMMWVSLVILPLSAISSIIYFSYVNREFKKIEELESDMTTKIQENVNGARVVRAFANEKYEFQKMDVANQKYAKADLKFGNTMALYWGFSDFSVMIQYVLTLAVGIYLAASSGAIDSADIITCLYLMGMLVWPVRGLGRIIADFGKTFVAVNRLEEVLNEPSEFEINGSLTPNIQGNIEFKNVSFKFIDDDKHLLKDVSFSIKAGETIAIVGKTGCGKSTICNLITRMLEYDSGEILLDGIPLKDIEKKHLRRNVRMVLQDPFLFSKTVFENIAISQKDISLDDGRIIKAAKMAALHDEINNFDKGYKTIVGEKGTTLSGGQKQRVAIARILVDDSPVIIFDDSLSALDTKTDLLIRQALNQKGNKQTMIIITHRTTTAKEADKIIILDNGKIASIGTHDELVKQEGLYKELWGIQGELEDEFNLVMNGGDN